MATTTVSDAVILPQSQGTGLSGENATIDAAINGVLNRYVGGEYVASEYSTGLQFQNHDGVNDTVEVGPGIVFVQDNSTSTSGERGSGGNPQAESSTTSGYDTELPEGHTYAVLLPTATEISVSDSTLNEVYVDIDDVTANNSVNLEHDGSTTASPGNTSLKIGETNPDDSSADTRANDDANPTYNSLTVNGTTTTNALNADNTTIKNSERFVDGSFRELGSTAAVSFDKRIAKNGTSESWTNAARFNHDGSNNRAVVGAVDLVIADPTGSTSVVSQDGFVEFDDKDNSWGSTGATTSVGSNIRLKIDNADASILFLQVDLDLSSGFEVGIFSANLITNSNEPTIVDPDGWTN